MAKKMNISKRIIGQNERPYIIAEIGANHNGDMDLCKRLIDTAVELKVDAVKFQSWTDKTLISRSLYDKNAGLHEEISKHQLDLEKHREIADYCAYKDITFCSTPFSNAEVDMLDELGVPFFKVASMDINNLKLLRYIAGKKKPMIVATGMAGLGEIERAVNTIREAGNEDIVLLHCISLYPPAYDMVNLNNIRMLSEVFDVPVGFSDHTIGVGCPLAAIALGACVIEKHFTMDKKMAGWDHAVSANPEEMGIIVSEGANIWSALGKYQRIVSKDEIDKSLAFRRSIVMKRAMKAGEVITEEDLDFKRPGTGISPDKLSYVIGHKLTMNIGEDDLLQWDHLET